MTEVMSTNDVAYVRYDDAIKSVNTLIQWCEEKQATKHIQNLFNLRSNMVEEYMATPKVQKFVTDYFRTSAT